MDINWKVTSARFVEEKTTDIQNWLISFDRAILIFKQFFLKIDLLQILKNCANIGIYQIDEERRDFLLRGNERDLGMLRTKLVSIKLLLSKRANKLRPTHVTKL